MAHQTLVSGRGRPTQGAAGARPAGARRGAAVARGMPLLLLGLLALRGCGSGSVDGSREGSAARERLRRPAPGPPAAAARRQLQRTVETVRWNDMAHVLDQGCVDDPSGFLREAGLGCSQLLHSAGCPRGHERCTRSEDECEDAGLEWTEDQRPHDAHEVQGTCRDASIYDIVHHLGCGHSLTPTYIVGDVCPFACFHCDVAFDALNRLFIDMTVNSPDLLIDDIDGRDIDINIRELSCYDVSFGSLRVETTRDKADDGDDRVTARVNASQVTVTCQADITWSVPRLIGSGRHQGSSGVELSTALATIQSDLVFTSPNLNTTPPCRESATGCSHRHTGVMPPAECAIDLGTLHYIHNSGDTLTSTLVGWFADSSWLVGLVRDKVDDLASDKLCELLGDLVSEKLGGFVTDVGAALDRCTHSLPAPASRPAPAAQLDKRVRRYHARFPGVCGPGRHDAGAAVAGARLPAGGTRASQQRLRLAAGHLADGGGRPLAESAVRRKRRRGESKCG